MMDSKDNPSTLSPVATPASPFARFLISWQEWWSSLSLMQKWLPAAGAFAIWTGFAALGGFRTDHLNMGLAILFLGYSGRLGRVVLRFLLPLILTGVVYDSQRFYSDYIRGTIRVQEPYLFDKTFFGIPTAQGVLTPNEWWQLHTHPVLDFITGTAYLIFIGVFVTVAAYFQFWVPRKNASRLSPSRLERIKRLSPGVMWAFFWVNVIGYTTYYWYPAAPPWYVSLYGLGPARLDVGPNPAGCARFDALLGTHFFTGMYGRSADVFGAIPSLHIAYPLLSALFAFQFGVARTFTVAFYLLMCFSAVYLNHHYLLDILWGSTYSVLIWALTNRFLRGRATQAQ